MDNDDDEDYDGAVDYVIEADIFFIIFVQHLLILLVFIILFVFLFGFFNISSVWEE